MKKITMNLQHLATLIEHECQMAKKYEIFGTQDFHIEKVERLPDEGKAFNFRVTTWNDQSEDPRKVREMSLVELMDLLGRIIAHRAVTPAVDLIENS